MAADRTVTVRLQAIVDGWKQSLKSAGQSVTDLTATTAKGTKQADKSFQDMSKSAASHGKAIGLALVGGAYAAYKLAGAASDLSETQSKTNEIFGDGAKQLDQWSDQAAESMGQSKRQALDAASTFGIFGKSAGLAGQDLVQFSTQMTGLASDLASFNNTSPEDAITAIGAAMRGEAEPIRQYGVLLDDATLRNRALQMGLISTTKQALTPQQRVLAAYNEILAQTKTQQGDFARTSDGMANSQRIAAAEFENTRAKLGEDLTPAMTAAFKAASDVLGVFNAMPGPLRTTVIAVAALAAGAVYVVPKLLAARTAMLEFKAAQIAAGKGGGGLRGGLSSTAGMLTGPWGVALGVGVTALGIFAAKHAETKQRVEDLTEAIKADSGALGENARAKVEDNLASQGAIDAARKLGISLETLTDAALGFPDAQAAVNEVLEANIDAEQRAAAGGKAVVQRTSEQFNAATLLTSVIGRQADETSKAQQAAEDHAEAMGGATYAAYQYTGQMTAAERATSDQNEAIEKQIGLLEDQATAALDVADAEQRYRENVRTAHDKLLDLNKAIAEHGKKSKEARLAQEQYDQALRDAERAAIDAAKKTRDEALAKAEAAGKSEDAAAANKAYRGELVKLRDQAAPGSKLRKYIRGLIGDLDALGQDRTANVTINISQRRGQINRQKASGNGPAMGGLVTAYGRYGRAGGGLVTGYGTDKSDSIPVNMSNGEYVMRAAAVRRIGVGTLSAMNAGGGSGGITYAPVFRIDARGSQMTEGQFRRIAKDISDQSWREYLRELRAV